jgi:thiamine-phosphate pyrophosphorylase
VDPWKSWLSNPRGRIECPPPTGVAALDPKSASSLIELTVRSTIPRIHAVTSADVLTSPQFGSTLESLAGSVDLAIHIRNPEMTAREFARYVHKVQNLSIPVIVNERVDVAASTGAEGVHLPADGISAQDAHQLVGPAWVGCSTHSVGEARRALDDGADYVFLGPIWETETHPGQPGLGPAVIEQVVMGRVIAIGGVTASRAGDCATAGAYGVATISALWSSPDPSRVVKQMSLSFSQNG